MKKLCASFLLLFALSCRIHPGSDTNSLDEKKVFRLRLNPPAGSRYEYEISNESEFKLEVNDRKIDNANKAEVGVAYTIDKDTTGDFTLHLQYYKIKLHTKNGDTESDLDAANANSPDPTERMLGFIKNARVTIVLSPIGETRSITGLKEIVTSFMAQLDNVDATTRKAMQEKWNSLIGGDLVTGNMEQLFRIFPDSGVHIGDKWKLASIQKGDFKLNARSNYTLTGIADGVAYIDSDGDMSGDSSTVSMLGYQVTPNLKGHQHGDYQMETSTGMVLKATITGTVDGTIQMMGQDIPVTIESSVKMTRR